MHNETTPPGGENGDESPVLSVNLGKPWKWALRRLAKEAGYRTLSDYIYALLKEHTDVENVALLYPKGHPGTLENHA